MTIRMPDRAARTERIRGLLALRENAPDYLAQLLAARYVDRGVAWLAKNAPTPGWWRLCLDHRSAKSRIRTRYAEESVLARIFEYDPRFALNDGYVRDWKVLEHFFGPLWKGRSYRLGFTTNSAHAFAPYQRYSVILTDHMLDREWARFVENPPGDWTIQYRHPTEIDRRFASLNFLWPPRRTLLRIRLPFRQKRAA